MNTERKVYINNDFDIVMVRLQARKMAREMGFRTADQARISLAASELARVISWDNDDPGEIIMSNTKQNEYQGLQVVCLVKLEYIPEEDKSNWTKIASMPERSLAGACNLADESIVKEQNEKQAMVILIKWLH